MTTAEALDRIMATDPRGALAHLAGVTKRQVIIESPWEARWWLTDSGTIGREVGGSTWGPYRKLKPADDPEVVLLLREREIRNACLRARDLGEMLARTQEARDAEALRDQAERILALLGGADS